MTDQITGIGSEQSGNPAGGNGDTPPKGSEATPAAATGLAGPSSETGNLDWAKTKGWVAEDGSLKGDAVLEGYRALEKRIGSMSAIPDDKAKPEDVEAFAKKLGWPGSAEGYEFTKPEGFPADMPYDENMASTFKAWANELKLPKAQAQALHDRYVTQAATDAQTFYTQRTEMAAKAHGELVKDWGAPGSETYIRNVDAATRALRSDPKTAGLEQELKASGLLTKDGHFTMPQLAHLLAGHGRSLQNDSFVGNGSGAATQGNPFKQGDPAHSLSTQGEIIRTDPARARQLAAAASWHPDAIKAIG